MTMVNNLWEFTTNEIYGETFITDKVGLKYVKLPSLPSCYGPFLENISVHS